MSKVLVYDLGGTKCDVAVFDAKGNLLVKERVLTNSDEGKDAVIKQILNLAEKLITQFKDIEKCVIGVPGIVAKDQSTIINLPNILGFKNVNLGQIFHEKYPQMQVLVENDANLFTFGAFQLNTYKPEVFLGITLGTGIGGGIVVDKKLLKGQNSLAGEFGHMVIDFNGEKCNCGQKGCWERYASASAFLRRTEKYLQKYPQTKTALPKENLIMHDVAKALSEGDEFCLKMLHETTDFLAIGLSNLINLIDPGVIVLGGSLGKLLEFYSEKLNLKIQKRLMKKEIQCQIKNAKQSDLELLGGFFYIQ